jgi:hypothetical protein
MVNKCGSNRESVLLSRLPPGPQERNSCYVSAAPVGVYAWLGHVPLVPGASYSRYGMRLLWYHL